MTEPAADTQPSSLEDGRVRVRRALISVSDKTGVADFAKGLAALGVEILSTGGTATALREAGLEVTDVSQFTGQEEILGGRVKTLHPRLHAALLARRGDPEHVATLEREGIEPIDLVCVNLYPFEQTVAGHEVAHEVAIENIDIGGPTMIRAAAKNHESVAVVVKPESYDAVLAELEEGEGEISAATRHWLANEAFAQTASYDAAISRWFRRRYEQLPTYWVTAWEKELDLSYGENPHQRAALYVEPRALSHVLSRVSKLHGKPLSFNNVLDLNSARTLLGDLEGPGCVIVKHNNPCGVAEADEIGPAYEKAFACDPMSAFGGVIALNRPVDGTLAGEITRVFTEVLIAPHFTPEAREAFAAKPNTILLQAGALTLPELSTRNVTGGLLLQDADLIEDGSGYRVVTEKKPERIADLLFAWRVAKRVRSNAIVLARDGATFGIGGGQTSRVDASELAVKKAGERTRGAVAASDAFFPFADGVEALAEAGITAVIQPGGSRRDEEVIEAANERGLAMVFTGRRHFLH